VPVQKIFFAGVSEQVAPVELLMRVTVQPGDGVQVKPLRYPMPLVFRTWSWYAPLR
jgi:hypothetical protein